MASNIEHLVEKFKAKLVLKLAARRGIRMNANKILKELGKARKVYKESRDKLRLLESELEHIESNIRDCKDGVHSSRSQMLRLNKVLQNMDLADANCAIFYDNDAADIGYLINGEEHYLDTNDDGEISLTLMPERRRLERAERRAALGDIEYDDGDDEPDQISDSEDNEGEDQLLYNNDSDDNNFVMHPNLRFID